MNAIGKFDAISQSIIYLVIYSSLSSYAYWSSFNLPLNGPASLELLFSSSFEYLLMGFISMMTAYAWFDLLSLDLKISKRHFFDEDTLSGKLVIIYTLMFFIPLSCALLAIVLTPKNSAFILISSLLVIISMYMKLSSKLENKSHRLHGKLTHHSVLSASSSEGSLASYYFEREIKRKDDLRVLYKIDRKKINVMRGPRLASISLIFLLIAGAYLASIRAHLIINKLSYSYIESYDKKELRYLGYAFGNYVFLDDEQNLLFKNKVTKMKRKQLNIFE